MLSTSQLMKYQKTLWRKKSRLKWEEMIYQENQNKLKKK